MGLVEYASSDEDEEVKRTEAQADDGSPAQSESKPVKPSPIIGPTIPSNLSVPSDIPPLPEDDDLPEDDQRGEGARALIHDLTLPTCPNLDIPPSPPSSPPLAATQKLTQFLALKRKGTHFNTKLEQSTALRNPALMDKLLAYVDVDDAAQYETSLPRDLWDVGALPDWAFREQLRRTREKLVKKREGEKRTAVEFVGAVNPPPGSTAAGGLVKSEKRWK